MTKTNSEKMVYTINIIFVIVVLLFAIPRSFEAGDKATIIYLALTVLFIYFFSLSIFFFKSQLNTSKISRLWFNILSLVPGLYLIPGFIIHIEHYTVGDILSNTFVNGSAVWLIFTVFNILNKEKMDNIKRI